MVWARTIFFYFYSIVRVNFHDRFRFCVNYILYPKFINLLTILLKNKKMFSGLTNQMSSWMGSVKGEPQDEEVPTPTGMENPKSSEQMLSSQQQQPLEEVPVAEDVLEGAVDEAGKIQRYVFIHFFNSFAKKLFKLIDYILYIYIY